MISAIEMLKWLKNIDSMEVRMVKIGPIMLLIFHAVFLLFMITVANDATV